MSNLVLSVDGQDHEGWTRIEVSRSIEDLSGAFNLTLTNKWRSGKSSLAILPGAEASVSIGGKKVITGYVDNFEAGYDSETQEFRVSGRDKTADLIDSSIASGTGEYKNLTVDKIITELVSPFGITIKSEINSPLTIKKFNVEQGMSVYEAIQKLCEQQGCLALSDGEGNLVLANAGDQSGGTDLVEGENILSARATYDFSQRFSEYIVKGQELGDDNIDAKTATSHKAKVSDPNIKRYRPLLIVADGQANLTRAQQRAKWEAAVRRGKSRTYRITVQGWETKSGLWNTNQNVQLRAPNLGVNSRLLVSGVAFTMDGVGEGTRTTLTLNPKEAFIPLGGTSAGNDTWLNDLMKLGTM